MNVGTAQVGASSITHATSLIARIEQQAHTFVMCITHVAAWRYDLGLQTTPLESLMAA
jgi:hypothetical protein